MNSKPPETRKDCNKQACSNAHVFSTGTRKKGKIQMGTIMKI